MKEETRSDRAQLGESGTKRKRGTNPEVSPESSIGPSEVSRRSGRGNLAGSDGDELVSLGLEVGLDVVVVDEVLSKVGILPSGPGGILRLGVVVGEKLLVLHRLNVKPKKGAENIRGEFDSSGRRKESPTNLLSGELSLGLDDSVRNEPVVELRISPGRPNGILGSEVVGLGGRKGKKRK